MNLQIKGVVDSVLVHVCRGCCRAVQLKVAIPSQWLRFHQKEGLYQEEEITARTSGRSHLIKEQEAKNYNFLCGGGGAARWLPKLAKFFPQNRRVCHLSPRDWSAIVANDLQVTREVSTSGPPGVTWPVWWGGGGDAISSNTLQLMVISRNFFYKIEVQSLPLPYFNVKVCPPSLHELWEANILPM
jgi:hypothetical protein